MKNFLFPSTMLKKLTIIASALAVMLLYGCTAPVSKQITTPTQEQAKKELTATITVKEPGAEEKMTDGSATKESIVEEKKQNGSVSAVKKDEPTYEDYSKGKYLALKGKTPFILFFHANWCPICRNMEKNLMAELSTFPAGTKILKANYDTETDLKAEYDVRIQSTIVVVDATGKATYKAQDPAFDDLKAEITKSLGN